MVTRERTMRDVVLGIVEKITGVSPVTDQTKLDLSDSRMVLGECADELDITSMYILDYLELDYPDGSMAVGQIIKECEQALAY